MNRKSVNVNSNYIVYSIQWDKGSKNSALNKNRTNATNVPPIFIIIKYILNESKVTMPVNMSTQPSLNAKKNAPQKSN